VSNWPVLTPDSGIEYNVDATSTGASVDVSSANNSKGSWTQLVASTPYGTAAIQILVKVTANGFTALDIGVGGSGSETVVAPDVLLAMDSVALYTLTLPLAIPAGSRIAARIAGSNNFATNTVEMAIRLLPPTHLVPVGFQRMSRLASPTTNDAGGTGNTFSAWAEVTSSLGFTARAFLLRCATDASSTGGSALAQVGIGAASSEQVVGTTLHGKSAFASFGILTLLPVNAPRGERVAFRHASDATAAAAGPRVVTYTIWALG
jgi:hypothetical protein